MLFYGGRVSLLRIDGNIFYKEGKEKKIDYFIEVMGQSFESFAKYKIHLINEPWIDKDIGFFGGILGREGSTRLPKRDGGRFNKVNERVYPFVRYFFIRSEQVLLIEKNTSVFHNSEKVFEYLSDYLNTVLIAEGLSVHIHPLTNKGEFWNVLNELKSVNEVRLHFVMPNFLGDLYKDMRKLLNQVNQETNATEIETNLISSAGYLSVPKNPSYESAVGWIEDGGGTWEVVQRGKKGKPKKISNKKSLTFYERDYVLENLTFQELLSMVKEFDLGPHKIKRSDKE